MKKYIFILAFCFFQSLSVLATEVIDWRDLSVTLSEDTDHSGKTVLSNVGTQLSITQDLTLTTDQQLTVGTLELVNSRLSLGSETTDLHVMGDLSFDDANDGIISGEADLVVLEMFTMLGGVLSSTGGMFTFEQGGMLLGGSVYVTNTDVHWFVGGFNPPPEPPVIPNTLPRIATGSAHACALLNDGSAKCWGQANSGQLGFGDITPQYAYSAIDVAELNNATQLVAGSYHSCALLDDSTVKCWGDGSHGRLGLGSDESDKLVPTAVPGLSNIVQVQSKRDHTCALSNDGTIQCWGKGDRGQLGNGSTDYKNVPTLVTGIDNATYVSVGRFHSCARLSDATVKCWGRNNHGQLGNGNTDQQLTPVAVSGLSHVSQVAVGLFYTCALMDDGNAKCWGRNSHGQLGNNDSSGEDHTTPVTVVGVSNITQIDTGNYASCAVLDDGSAKCWGGNEYGELGIGNTVNQFSAVPLSLSNITELSLAPFYGCALTSDGAGHCWGWGGNAVLGNGSTQQQLTPGPVLGLNLNP